MDNDTVKILLEIKADVAATLAKVDSLGGPEGRLTKLEDSQTYQWWFTAAIAPVLTVVHGVARKLGVQI